MFFAINTNQNMRNSLEHRGALTDPAAINLSLKQAKGSMKCFRHQGNHGRLTHERQSRVETQILKSRRHLVCGYPAAACTTFWWSQAFQFCPTSRFKIRRLHATHQGFSGRDRAQPHHLHDHLQRPISWTACPPQKGQPVTVDIFNETDVPEQLHWPGQMVPVDVD